MDVRIEVDVREFSEALGRLGEGVGRALDDAALAGGLVVEGAAKENIIDYDFIDTGATLNSTEARRAGDGEAEIGPDTEYAIFGELGLGGHSEKPFMRRALTESKGDVQAAVAEALREALRKAAK